MKKKRKINIGLLSSSLCTSIMIYKGKKKKEKKITLLEQNFYACYELASSRDNSTLIQLTRRKSNFANNWNRMNTWIVAREALRQILHLIKKQCVNLLSRVMKSLVSYEFASFAWYLDPTRTNGAILLRFRNCIHPSDLWSPPVWRRSTTTRICNV